MLQRMTIKARKAPGVLTIVFKKEISVHLLFHSLTLIPTMPLSQPDIHSPLAPPTGPLPLPKDKQQIVRPALLRETEHTHTQRPLSGILFPRSLVVYTYCVTSLDMCHFV